MKNKNYIISGNHDETYVVRISDTESRYINMGRKSISFHSSTFCADYLLKTIMFDDDGMPTKLDQPLCIDSGQDATISGEEMAKVRTWAWNEIEGLI